MTPHKGRMRRSPALGAAFGPRLQTLRQARGWTQAELARQVGLAQRTIWMYEQNRFRPRPETLHRLAAALGADTDALAHLAGYPDATGRAADVAVFGARLVALRASQALSQRALAQRVGVAHTAVGAFERGRTRPRPETLRRLAAVLETDYAALARVLGYPDTPEERALTSSGAADLQGSSA